MTVVTPFTGVWVEISVFLASLYFVAVTPFTGVWVEIGNLQQIS